MTNPINTVVTKTAVERKDEYDSLMEKRASPEGSLLFEHLTAEGQTYLNQCLATNTAPDPELYDHFSTPLLRQYTEYNKYHGKLAGKEPSFVQTSVFFMSSDAVRKEVLRSMADSVFPLAPDLLNDPDKAEAAAERYREAYKTSSKYDLYPSEYQTRTFLSIDESYRNVACDSMEGKRTPEEFESFLMDELAKTLAKQDAA